MSFSDGLYFLFNVLSSLHCPPLSVPLAHNDRRLGAAAASGTLYAGYELSFPQYTFRGVSAAVAPNRKLSAGIFYFIFSPTFLFKNPVPNPIHLSIILPSGEIIT